MLRSSLKYLTQQNSDQPLRFLSLTCYSKMIKIKIVRVNFVPCIFSFIPVQTGMYCALKTGGCLYLLLPMDGAACHAVALQRWFILRNRQVEGKTGHLLLMD